MIKGIKKNLRIVLLFIVVISSITLVKAQDPGGPLDPNDPDSTFPVPVKSIALTASRSTQKVNLTWNTIGESQVATFILEKSTNGKVFNSLFTVLAKNTVTATYSFVDESTIASYYRVKATDKNGAFTFSAIKYVAGNSDLKFNVFPIPLVGSTLNIATINSTSSSKYYVSIFNISGKKVLNTQIDGKLSINELNVGKLAAGVYNLVIVSDDKVVYTKTIEVLN